MALDDTAVFIPGTGHFYSAPVGTARPTTVPGVPEVAWEELGHTSVDNGLTITRDGGDSTVLGTWQNPSLRERRDPTTFALTFSLHQFDNETLEMYFGAGDTTEADVFGVPVGQPTPIERALYVRIVDGANELGLFLPKVSLASDDDVSVDVEALLEMPVRATVLGVTGSNLMEFLRDGLGLVA